MRGLITLRREPRLSSLPGVSVCSDTGTRARTQIHIVVTPLRRFIYLLDSCPEPLTRFSTGAESPTKHSASFSPAYEHDCHTPSHPRVLPDVPPSTCGCSAAHLSLPIAFFMSPGSGCLFGSLLFSSAPPSIAPSAPSLLLSLHAFPHCFSFP